MTYRQRPERSFLIAVTALLALTGAATADQAKPAAPKKQASRESGWPRKVQLGDMALTLDAPQADSLDGTKLKARGTAQGLRAGVTEPSIGMIWYESEVQINRDRRVVTLASVSVPRVQLGGVPLARQQRMATRLSQVLTRLQLKLPLDDVLAAVKLASRRGETAPKLGTEPPKILLETEPAILVIFDGEPRFRAVEGSKLERALNTPFLVLHDAGANAYYLSGGTSWFRAPSATGPWTKADDVPREAVQIAHRDLKDAGIPDKEVEQASASADKRVPKILVATEPTELIVSDGPPKWSPEVEGELSAMSNTVSDVFQTLPDQRYWLVLSGRWYQSGSLNGPWVFVEPDQLPGSFRRVQASSAKADALAFVPGTGPSREALKDANAPRTAAIRRSDAHVTVSYDGDPKFEAVPGTHVEYALNTAENVLRIRGRYFACDQGVWFSSDAPTGPWRVADAIPDDEIQAIPPESPVYNTRFATVYDSTPDVVYVAYTPAYLGSYPYYGTVVFGTGWFYRPWWGGFYYPRPWTWGFGARYAFGYGWGYGFGWGPAWGGFRYGFGFGWGARWCGPGGFFRPAYRNVNITRNVTINRNVTVNRNLYTSGANQTRATTAQASGRTAGTQGTAGTQKTASTQRTAGKAASTSGKAAAAHPTKARVGGKPGGRAAKSK
jgi:hypothetical protein